jgi:Fe-S-cluster-containing dehydrogenase component
MAKRVLYFDADQCGGCLSCVTNCSQRNEGCSGIGNARLRLALPPFTGDYRLTYCRQCARPACAEACPVGAIVRNANGYLDVDYGLCIGCNACLPACPFGAMLYDTVGDKVIKCHTCQGDPACAAVCPTGALVWIEVTELAGRRRRAAAGARQEV